MPGLIPPFVPTSAGRTALWLSVILLMLSGCASHSLVSNDELEADRQKRQALQVRQDELLVKQQELLKRIINLTSLQGELETLLAAEEAKRRSLEQQLATASRQSAVLERREKELERVLREQQSTTVLKNKEGDAELYLQLLEKKAQLARLNDQLGEAILEVVRTKAKLRSMESKAEAASDLAEAEIAIQALVSQGEAWKADPGVSKARELSALSAREFEQGNYGGALYLTGQAKNVIKSAEARSVNQGTHSMVAGEKPFALPLPLVLLGDGDVRQGPGDRSGVVASLAAGADLVAYSYKGQWVRVKTSKGVGGWVYYKNLGHPG